MNQKCFYLLTIILVSVQPSFAQNWVLKSGTLTVVSEAALNTVKGITKSFNCNVNVKNKLVNFSCDANTLDFGNPLIKENFSTQILNLEKYPLITFTSSAFKLDERKKTIIMKGIIEMNGHKKTIETTANWTKNKKEVKLDFNYLLLLKDFNVNIPNILLDAIAENVSVTVHAILTEK